MKNQFLEITCKGGRKVLLGTRWIVSVSADAGGTIIVTGDSKSDEEYFRCSEPYNAIVTALGSGWGND